MPLNKDTLELILANAAVATGAAANTETPALILPDSFKLHSTEHLALGRARFRGALHTHSLADFSSYVGHHISDDFEARCFVDQDKMAATVIFNLGDPGDAGHGDDSATLTLKPTAAYSGLQAIIGRPLTQQQLAEWLEDWTQHLQAQAHGEVLDMLAAINAVRRMSIKATAQRDSVVGDFAASRSSMDEIEAKSLDTLPTQFTFSTIPFEGLQVAHIPLRLSVITGEKDPILKLRWVAEEAQREAFAREFKAVLQQEAGGFVPLTIGTFNLGK